MKFLVQETRSGKTKVFTKRFEELNSVQDVSGVDPRTPYIFSHPKIGNVIVKTAEDFKTWKNFSKDAALTEWIIRAISA